jgi:type IV pilus assembly protein PilC
MHKYQYSAIQNSGTRISGEITAANHKEAVTLLSKKNLRSFFIWNFATKLFYTIDKLIRPQETALIASQLALSTSAGMTLLDSLSSMLNRIENWKYKPLISSIIAKLQKGLTPSRAFSEHPRLFDSFFCRMLKSAETERSYSAIFSKLSETYEEEAHLNRKLKSIFIYPALIIFIALSGIFLLITIAVPNSATVSFAVPAQDYINLKSAFFDISQWLGNKITVVLLFLSVGFLAIFSILARVNCIQLASGIFLKNLPSARIIRKLLITRLIERYIALYSCNISPSEAMTVAISSLFKIPNSDEKHVLKGRQVGSVSIAISNLLKTELLPPFIIQLVVNAKNNTEMLTMFEEIGRFYHEEVDAVIDAINTVIEPTFVFMSILTALSILWIIMS